MASHFAQGNQQAPPGGQGNPRTRNLLLITTLVLVLALSGVGWYPGFSPPSAPVYYNTTVTHTISTTQYTTNPKLVAVPVGADTYLGAISLNGECQYFVTPTYNVTEGVKEVDLGLFNYVAAECHEETIAVLAYLTPYTRGGILGLSEDSCPFGPPNSSTVPLLYITNGTLVFAEVAKPYSPGTTPFEVVEPGIGRLLSVPNDSWVAVGANITRPGFYWIALEEWTNAQGTFVSWYLDGKLVAKLYSPRPNATSLLGGLGPYRYNFVGIVNAKGWPLYGNWWYRNEYPPVNGSLHGWYPFNGSIAALAVYPRVLTPLQLDQMVKNGSIPECYYLLFLASKRYYQDIGVWIPYGFNPLGREATNTSISVPVQDVSLVVRGNVVGVVLKEARSYVVTVTPPTGSYNVDAVIGLIGYNVVLGVLALLLAKKK